MSGDQGDQLKARVVAELDRQTKQSLMPGLYVVATPIGNLGDVSLRALAVLAGADLICAEDTRHSRTLLSHFGIKVPLRAYHDHSGAGDREAILAELGRGKRVALISDAGTPLISDPGLRLVEAAVVAGHGVWAIPGASAVLAALAVAGLPTDQFLFAGFLPPRQGRRRERIEELAGWRGTLVVYESPHRLAETLADLADAFGARPAAIARELTKLHEEVRRGSLVELAADASSQNPKGEIVILIGAAPETAEVSDAAIDTALERALASDSVRDASSAVADALGVPRSRVYRRALAQRRT